MTRLDFTLEAGIILCGAEIRIKKSVVYLRMALDTGATTTMIPPEALLRIGINPSHAARMKEVTTGSGRIVCPLVTIPHFIALGRHVRNVDVFCHTLPSESPVDGLLGLDFLRNLDLRINFKKGFLEIR